MPKLTSSCSLFSVKARFSRGLAGRICIAALVCESSLNSQFAHFRIHSADLLSPSPGLGADIITQRENMKKHSLDLC